VDLNLPLRSFYKLAATGLALANQFRGSLARMKIADLFRSHRLINGGAAGVYPRPALVRSSQYAEPLAQQRDRLISEERQAEARLLAVRSALDDVTNELMAEAHGPTDQTRIRGLRALFEMSLSSFARHATPAVMQKIFRSGLNPPLPAVPGLLRGPPQPSGRIDPVALARSITRSGRRASAEEPEELPADPVARSIVLAGRKANGKSD
jgi:hypothetical protein